MENYKNYYVYADAIKNKQKFLFMFPDGEIHLEIFTVVIYYKCDISDGA